MRIAMALVFAAGLVAGCGGDGNSGGGAGSGGTGGAAGGAAGSGGTGGSAGSAGAGGSGGSAGTSGGTDMSMGSLQIHLGTKAGLGSFIVDGAGSTVYIFGNDVPGTTTVAPVSNCDAASGCLGNWPVFHVDTVSVSADLTASDFTELTRADGTKQTVYKGWPLYYYANDAAAGDTNGQAVGNLWFVAAQPLYNVMVRGDATMKHFLTDGAGRSLYAFSKDTTGTAGTPPASACMAAGCAANWPVYFQATVLPTGNLTATDLTVLTWTDGSMTKEIVFKGHPLYYYVGDTAPGQANGRGLAAGAWQTFDPTAP